MVELRGLLVSNKIKEDVEIYLKNREDIPCLAIVRVGDREDDISYERGAIKKLESFGLKVKSYVYDEKISEENFLREFSSINEDENIDGILILRPLPKQIDEKNIEEIINPKKDLDGISIFNKAGVFSDKEEAFAPCTAKAVVEMLKFYEIDLAHKNIVILGRSLVVGKPLSMLLLKENATVTICHSKTKDVKEVCRNADILVVAIGRAKLVDETYIKEGAIVIDVGINIDENGKLCGDVNFESISKKASMASPVPGGLGAVTTAVLAKHLIETKL